MSKKNFINSVHVEGHVYEHKLEEKVTGPNSKKPGTPFISGTLNVATDDKMLNVVPVHFTYVTAVTSKGAPNATYNTLKAIIDGKIGNVMEHGAENAGRVRIDTAIALNEWFDSRTEGNPLISVKRNEGGFVHQLSMGEVFNPDETQRCSFDTDMLITKAVRKEPNDEKGTPERVILSGYIFDFRKQVLPVEFTVLKPGAMDYFEALEPSEKNPFFTRVKGQEISQTIVREITEESAFGDAIVRQTRSSYRDFIVTWATNAPYDWDDESSLLATELQDMLAQRQVYLAETKKRQDEYRASRENALASNTTTPTASTTPAKGGYDF